MLSSMNYSVCVVGLWWKGGAGVSCMHSALIAGHDSCLVFNYGVSLLGVSRSVICVV